MEGRKGKEGEVNPRTKILATAMSKYESSQLMKRGSKMNDEKRHIKSLLNQE